MLTIIVGGSIDSDVAEVTVAPVRSSPVPAVMTEIPPASVRMACFSVAASAGGVVLGDSEGHRNGAPRSHRAWADVQRAACWFGWGEWSLRTRIVD